VVTTDNESTAAMKSSSSPAEKPDFTEESVAHIAVSLVTEQKEMEKCHLNIIVHNLEESNAIQTIQLENKKT